MLVLECEYFVRVGMMSVRWGYVGGVAVQQSLREEEELTGRGWIEYLARRLTTRYLALLMVSSMSFIHANTALFGGVL